MTKRYWVYLLPLFATLIMAGCSGDQRPAATKAAAPKKPVLTEPFRFHKLVEVSPGQEYDVLSWGRGSKDTGAFEILHSDSAARKYSTTTGDLDGQLIDAYNSDMDLDGNPEILIEAKTKDTVNYVTIYAFEFTSGKAQKLDFPKLTRSQRAGYRGEDNFYVEQGKLMREFPIYAGAAAKPLAEKRKFEYGLRNNSFTIKQLTKDSLSTAAQTAPEPVKKTTTEKKSTTTASKKSKKHTTEKPHKKKKKRHHSDEE